MTTQASPFVIEPLPNANFGALIRSTTDAPTAVFVEALESNAERLRETFYAANGFLYFPNVAGISAEPNLLVRLSRLFGPQVENNRTTFSEENQTVFNIHETVPEIILVTNLPPINSQPMARPDPPLTATGRFPTQFPHRRGWHTDQSFRRPPPDVSLFYAEQPVPQGQGQTLFADGRAAYASLPDKLKERIQGVEGWHVLPRTGRQEQAVRDGVKPRPLLPHQDSQRQPLVRIHPISGQPSLYLCEGGQMDWVKGPIVDMEPGLHGDGAKLVYELMTHITQPEFTYTHEWTRGDLVVYDNRNLLHAPTWYDAEKYTRVMWRTTVTGNPGPEYDGEKPSWIPSAQTPH